MSESLSPEQIAALVDKAQEGDLHLDRRRVSAAAHPASPRPDRLLAAHEVPRPISTAG